MVFQVRKEIDTSRGMRELIIGKGPFPVGLPVIGSRGTRPIFALEISRKNKQPDAVPLDNK